MPFFISLFLLLTLSLGGPTRVEALSALQVGDTGSAVLGTQEELVTLGYLSGADGVFGPATLKAVKAFQGTHGLYPDGVIGPVTGTALQEAASTRHYIVKRGDTLSSIADSLGASQTRIIGANSLANPNAIFPGQQLVIPGGSSQPGPPPPPPLVAEAPAPLQIVGGVVLGQVIPPQVFGVPGMVKSNPGERASPASRPAGKNKLALTFDGGPDGIITPQILALLGRYRVKATFFVGAGEAIAKPGIVRAMAKGGAVESLGYTGQNFCRLSLSQVTSRLQEVSRTIRKLTGSYPRFFRPPGGCLNATTLRGAAVLGESFLAWDNEGPAPLQVLTFARPGGVLMLPGTSQEVVADLPHIIQGLQAHYKLVTADQLSP